MKRMFCVGMALLMVLLTACAEVNRSHNAVAADVDLSINRVKAYYEQKLLEEQTQGYTYFLMMCPPEDVCLVNDELMEVLRLDEWKEVTIDPESEAYTEQRLYNHPLEHTDDYSVFFYIGREYGAVEVHVTEYGELDNGVKTESRVFERGVYFELPQDEPQEIAHKIHEMATEYYAQQKG